MSIALPIKGIHNLALLSRRELYEQSCIRVAHSAVMTVPVVMRTPLIFRLNNLIKNNPVLFGAGVALCKSLLADYLAQGVIENKTWDEINWRRTACIGLFGFCYTGIGHFYIYCKLYPYLFRGVSSKIKPMGQLMVDQLVHCPFVYFPAFYCVKNTVYHGTLSKDVISNSLDKYFNETMKQDLTDLWKLWIPANVLTFTVIPMHLRVSWIAGVSFIWTAYLSYSRGN